VEPFGTNLVENISVMLPRQKIFLCFCRVLKDEVSQDASSYEFYTQVHHKGTTKVVLPQRIIKIHGTSTPCGGGNFGGSVSFVAGRLYDFVACWLTSGRYKRGVAASWFCWSYRTFSYHNRPLNVNTGIGSVVQLITSLNGYSSYRPNWHVLTSRFQEILSCFSFLFLTTVVLRLE
jgi:hypothetical protein